MNKVVWVLQILLALAFIMPGGTKLFTPVFKMVEMHMLQPGQSPVPMRILGLLELMGVVGIILPWALKKLPVLTPIAAVGFAIVMVGALFVHGGMGDYKTFPMLIAIFVAAVIVAWYRFKGLRQGSPGMVNQPARA